jgi:predicted site-specific integrase-resolvase
MPRQSLEQLKQQREKINHRIQAIEARERTIQRKQDLQRAILVGRYTLKKAEQEGKLEQLYAEVASSLTRNIDRKLFELAANEKSQSKKKLPKTANAAKATQANLPPGR